MEIKMGDRVLFIPYHESDLKADEPMNYETGVPAGYPKEARVHIIRHYDGDKSKRGIFSVKDEEGRTWDDVKIIERLEK